MPGKKIDEALRKKIVEAHGKGLSMRTIAKEFGVGLSSVSRIVKEKGLQKGQEKGTPGKRKTERQRRIEALEKRIKELEAKILRLDAKNKW
jgi:transposase